jgi:hypothetical protein
MELNQHLVMRIIVIFFICSSKKLFVYNEEGLVLLCFIAFLGFSGSYFGGSVRDFFVERRETIKIELENYLDLRQDHLRNLEDILRSASYNKEFLLALEPICIQQMNKLITSREQGLPHEVSREIQKKLRALSDYHKSQVGKLQISIALSFRQSVLEAFQFSEKEQKLKSIREALQALKGPLK